MHQFRIAPLLLRGRIRAGTGLIDLLAVLAFTVSSWLLLSVLAGINAFVNRQFHPPAAFVAALGADATEGVAELVMWTLLAACAGVLLIVPLVTLGAAAARMGALGRDQRLSTLRLLGLTGGQAIALSTVETMLAGLIGGVLGVVGYLLTLPAWAAIGFQATPLSAAEMLLPIWAIAATVAGLVVLAGLSSVTGLMRLTISPLGVARRAPRPALKLWRLLAVPLVIAAWIMVAPMLNLAQEFVASAAVVLVVLALFMGVINLVGPWLLQLLGLLLTRSGRPAVLLAGRRLLADPKSAWRSVSGLAFVGFTGGALVSLPDFSAYSEDPLLRILAEDVRTGTYLTLGIALPGGRHVHPAEPGLRGARPATGTAPAGQPGRPGQAARPHPAGRGGRSCGAQRPGLRWPGGVVLRPAAQHATRLDRAAAVRGVPAGRHRPGLGRR